MSVQNVVLVSVIALNVVISVGLFVLWVRTARRMSKLMKMQHGLTSSNRGNIQANQKGIESNRESIATNKEGIEQNRANIATNRDQIEAIIEGQEEFKMSVRTAMYLREANVEKKGGLWCFEHKGEKKYFKPGRLEKVETPDETTEFVYDNDRVTATVKRGTKLAAEIVYTHQGSPVSGKIYERGKVVQSFDYDNLGQVVKAKVG